MDNMEKEEAKELKKYAEDKPKKSVVREIIEWAGCIIIAVILALIVRYYIGTPTIVQHPSMTPTLLSGERLFLNRLDIRMGKEIKRGEIITFEAPTKAFVPIYQVNLKNPVAFYDYEPDNIFESFTYYVLELNKTSYIKRVIALPGEHIKIEDGNVYINGELYEESYLPEGTKTTDGSGYFVDLVVPDGAVFVMGDNRGNSTDSRCFGCVPIDKIESKVLIRFWPLNKFGKVE